MNQNGLVPENFGARFSRCEATPSRTSGPENPSISSASEVSKEGPAIRSQWRQCGRVPLMGHCRRLALGARFDQPHAIGFQGLADDAQAFAERAAHSCPSGAEEEA